MINKIKLGPLAIFLTIITIVLTMLALLSFVTANADAALAERYAQVTQIKYALEKQGNDFLKDLDDFLKEGNSLMLRDDVTRNSKGVYSHIEELDEYQLTIEFETDGDRYQIKRWKISKDWEEENPFDNIWQP